MKLLDWMGRDILVPCDSVKVWKRVNEYIENMHIESFTFDAWTKVLSVTFDKGQGGTGYTNYNTIEVDISDLITGKMEVVSPGYKGEVNNEGLED